MNHILDLNCKSIISINTEIKKQNKTEFTFALGSSSSENTFVQQEKLERNQYLQTCIKIIVKMIAITKKICTKSHGQ